MKSLFAQYSRFYASDEAQQQTGQIVNVSDWPIGGDFMPYAEGTRPKFELFCPPDIESPFLIPNHRYLYKKTIQRKNKDPSKEGYIHYEQFWVEIVAYHLGRALGVEVPPAFVACRELADGEPEYACLIEWYYGYPNAPYATVQRGGELISQYIEGYDREKGTQHNFMTLAEIMGDKPLLNWFEKWVRMLCFDTLIGNTDRHQENWEIVGFYHTSLAGYASLVAEYYNFLSPAFDNGTAMGYEVIPDGLAKRLSNLDAYLSKGTHHMKWRIEDEKQQGHFELLANLIEYNTEAQSIISKLLNCDLSALYDRIMEFTLYDIRNENYRLTPARAKFMIALLKARHQKMKETIGV